MAFREHINKNGAFELTEKGTLIKCFEEVSAGTVNPQVAPAAFSNQTGGTANDIVQATPQAVAATTDATAAQLTATNAALTIINNNFADLTVKFNTLLNTLINTGVLH